jgi:hypothetical protein
VNGELGGSASVVTVTGNNGRMLSEFKGPLHVTLEYLPLFSKHSLPKNTLIDAVYATSSLLSYMSSPS